MTSTIETRSASPILTATYTRGLERVVIRFFDNEEAEVATIGTVSDADVEELLNAGGGNVTGWSSTLG